jgi:hypothetical protein
MPQQDPPVPQIAFAGVQTAGHPLARPRSSAVTCENFRVMPGNYLRLRGGRIAKEYIAAGTFYQFFDAPGGDPTTTHPFAQLVLPISGVGAAFWREIECDIFQLWGDTYSLQIATAYDSGYALTKPAAIAMVRDRVVMYNGLGVRGDSDSKPPFSTGTGLLVTRYFGLDAFCVGGNPTVASAASQYALNTVLTHVRIWVGLYNSGSGHYSNGVYAGEILATDPESTGDEITVSNLDRLTYAAKDASEEAELFYVFYATVDGGQVPYQILNATLDGPLTMAVDGADTISLSLVADTINGWILNLDAEMPTDNFPPRPMKKIAWVNGRVYGIPLGGGAGSAIEQPDITGGNRLDFSYTYSNSRYYGGLVYSAAASDYTDKAPLGNPEECWPVSNFTPTPTSEIPLAFCPAIDGRVLLVLTGQHSFLVQEALDKIHEWTVVSPIHGIAVAETLIETQAGACWVSQRNEVILLTKSGQLQWLSEGCQNLLSGKAPRFAQSILDPLNEINQYRVFFTDGTALVYDFITGAFTTALNQDYTAAATLTDHSWRKWHYAAKQHLYSTDGQGIGGLIPRVDEDFDSGQNVTYTPIAGEWEGQWEDYADANLRKQVTHIDTMGDPGLTLGWFADTDGVLEAVTDTNEKAAESAPAPQGWPGIRNLLKGGCQRFFYKFIFRLTGPSVQAYYPSPETEGRLASNFVGSILKALVAVTAHGGNRA